MLRRFNKIFKQQSYSSILLSSSSPFKTLPIALITRPKACFSSLSDDELDFGELINFYFVAKGQEIPVQGRVGENLLQIAKRNKDLLEGACDASAQCSTCHIILDENVYNLLPNPNESEEDLLDIAYGITQTSRLGCQIRLTRDFEGTKVELPDVQHNLLPATNF